MCRLRILSIITAVVATLAMHGCIYYPHNYYVYQPHNMPMLRDSGEITLDVSAACNFEMNHYWPYDLPEHESFGFNLNTAFSPINRLGIMGSYCYYDNVDIEWIKAHNAELAMGYYQPFGSKWGFDIYGGDRMSFQKHYFDNQGNASVQMHYIFVQPSIGFRTNYIDLAYATRMGYAFYPTIEHNVSHEAEANAINWLQANRNHVMGELSLTLRAGSKNVKGQLQLAHAFRIGPHEVPTNMPKLKSTTISLGLHFCFGNSNF